MDMTKYVKSMIDDFRDKFEGVGNFPWTDKLFTVNTKSKKLDYDKQMYFILPVLLVMKEMFLCTKQPRKTFRIK